MNSNDNTNSSEQMLDDRLKGLPKTMQASAVVWQRIEQRIQPKPASRLLSRTPLWAMAASLVVVITLVVLNSGPSPNPDMAESDNSAYRVEQPMLMELKGMLLQQAGAVMHLSAALSGNPPPDELVLAIEENGKAMHDIQTALENPPQDPQQASYLLQKLAESQRRQLRLLRQGVLQNWLMS